MSITRRYPGVSASYPIGSYCLIESKNDPVVLYERFIGEVVTLWSLPEGSTAYVWHENAIHKILIITKGWNKHTSAFIDASEETREIYYARRKYDGRRTRILIRRRKRNEELHNATSLGIDRGMYQLLTRRCCRGEISIVFTLLKTKKFKSEFRRSCAAQIRDWMSNPSSQLKYQKPLSLEQFLTLGLNFVINSKNRSDRFQSHHRHWQDVEDNT